MIFWLLKLSVWKVIVLPVDISESQVHHFLQLRVMKDQALQIPKSSTISTLLMIFQPIKSYPLS